LVGSFQHRRLTNEKGAALFASRLKQLKSSVRSAGVRSPFQSFSLWKQSAGEPSRTAGSAKDGWFTALASPLRIQAASRENLEFANFFDVVHVQDLEVRIRKYDTASAFSKIAHGAGGKVFSLIAIGAFSVVRC
jgi:hypothetical protein